MDGELAKGHNSSQANAANGAARTMQKKGKLAGGLEKKKKEKKRSHKGTNSYE